MLAGNKDVHSILPLPNGRFIITGSFRIEGANKSYISVARLNSDGSWNGTLPRQGRLYWAYNRV